VPLARWRREAHETAAARQAETERRRQREKDHRTRALVGSMLEQHKDFLLAVVGEALGEFKQQLIAEIEAKISAEVGQLRAETNVQRAIDKAEVVELPNVLKRTA
jgi:hypothetical protein